MFIPDAHGAANWSGAASLTGGALMYLDRTANFLTGHGEIITITCTIITTVGFLIFKVIETRDRRRQMSMQQGAPNDE